MNPEGLFFCASSCLAAQRMTAQGSMGNSPKVKHLLNSHLTWSVENTGRIGKN